jgi:hypothetical protein
MEKRFIVDLESGVVTGTVEFPNDTAEIYWQRSLEGFANVAWLTNENGDVVKEFN